MAKSGPESHFEQDKQRFEDQQTIDYLKQYDTPKKFNEAFDNLSSEEERHLEDLKTISRFRPPKYRANMVAKVRHVIIKNKRRAIQLSLEQNGGIKEPIDFQQTKTKHSKKEE